MDYTSVEMFSLKLILFFLCLNKCQKVLSFEFFDDFSANETSDRSAQKCGFSARDKCMEPMKKYLSTNQVSYGKNENELTETCRKVQKVVSCLDEFLENCKTNNHRMRDRVQKLVSGQRTLQNELCQEESPLRQKYLGFAHCIEHHSKDTLHCHKNYEKQMTDTMNEIPFQNQKFGYIRMDSICCALEDHNLCIRQILEFRCNKTAADLSEQLFRLSRSDIFNDCRQELTECNGFENNSSIYYYLCLTLTSISLIIYS